ncbi:MAG: endo-1,4-beta-xylanase [Actinobacteria bacterium]|nr:endo-1,4-beta-xylanase [Actinomycetota bacterium]
MLDALGLRTDVPWHATIGPSYVTESFHRAHEADSDATLVLNEFGYETDDGFASAVAKRAATLRLLDQLLDDDVPVHALGVQAHLHATNFAQAFEPDGYQRFLSEIADRGLKILITEMDVLDNGLPPEIGVRDQAVADVVGRYLEVALEEPAVASVVSFGLSDRYTWLEEDYQRLDGAPRAAPLQPPTAAQTRARSAEVRLGKSPSTELDLGTAWLLKPSSTSVLKPGHGTHT